MDMHNDSGQYLQLIEKQKLTLQRAKARQGERPRDREARVDAYFEFMLALNIRSIQGQDAKHMIHSSFIPPAYPPCITPMEKLRSIAIEDLQLETHHRVMYLSLRSITPPNRMTAISALMEDEKGDAVSLQLYKQEGDDLREAAEIVNVSTILLVKEPYFKVLGDGRYGVRVDHLSDVLNIQEDDTRISAKWQPRLVEIGFTAESLKLEGNAAIAKKSYRDAIAKYSRALRQTATAQEIEIIKCNRSLAFLRTKQFDAALSDTGFPNLNSKTPEKALFRAAEALYSLERYTECCEVLELLRIKSTNNSQALLLLDRARSRCLEQETGAYDFHQLQTEARTLRPPHLDHATYLGPVEIKQTESKGRGLFVSKAVKAGDLLLCEKAFSSVYIGEGQTGENDIGSHITLLLNVETNRAVVGGQADLIKSIAQKLYRNPSLAPGFTALHRGTYESVTAPTVDTGTIVDTFLVEQIVSLNVFSCPVSSVLHHNDLLSGKIEEQSHHSCGIWSQASYINHSCIDSAQRAFIGDMMIVRASRDLEPRTEITFWYQSPLDSDAKDLQEKLKFWGFVCDCALCTDSRATKAAVSTRRQNLRKDLTRAFEDPNGIMTDKIDRMLAGLKKTYTRPADEVPRLQLWDLQLSLTLAYATQENMIKCLESARNALLSLGFIVVGADSSSTSFAVVKWGLLTYGVVELFMHAAGAFRIMGTKEKARHAEEYAKTAYKIEFGEDTSFGVMHG